MAHQTYSVRCTVKIFSRINKMQARLLLVSLFTGLFRAADNEHISELVTAGHRLVIYHGCACGPPCDGIIDKGNEFVRRRLVYHVGYALLNITNNNSTALGVQRHDLLRCYFSLRFAEHLSHAEIIYTQLCSNCNSHSSLKSQKS